MLKYIGFLGLMMFWGCSLSTPKITDCAYSHNPDADEFTAQGECGKFLDADTLVLYPKHFKNLDFGDANYTTLYAREGQDGEKRVFYVSKTGKVVRTFFFDNGADWFAEGLARTIAHGKFGFINQKLEVVIEPQFDFAYPFEGGEARVCNGCIKKQEGEHSRMVGGKSGAIDKNGKIILPLK